MMMRVIRRQRVIIFGVLLSGTLIIIIDRILAAGKPIDYQAEAINRRGNHRELITSSLEPSRPPEPVDNPTHRIRLVDARALAIPTPEDPSDQETSQFPCINARIEHIDFPICIYSPIEDSVISGTFSNDGYFEADVVSKMIRHLREDRGIQFVDIGANIGTYTLPASRVSAGGVLAVEPNIESMTRLATSVVRGEVGDKVDLVLAAVSDRRTAGAQMAYDRLNRGDSFLLDGDADCDDAKRYLVGCLERRVDTVLLDDLVPMMRRKRAAMKVDVQGHEIRIFGESAAGRFFDEIDVTMVLMEWEEYTPSSASVKRGVKSSNRASESEVEDFLRFFYRRRYVAFDTEYRLLGRNWTTWPNNILLQKQ